MSTATPLDPSHPDFDMTSRIADAIVSRLGSSIEGVLAERIVGAVDFVLDPVRTGRTEVHQLDRVEKTFIGLKVEHMIRDMLDVLPGPRDLRIDGINVDVKNTIRRTRDWMIPLETYQHEEPVLLIASDPKARTSSMGVMMARHGYLGAENRDRKRRVLASAHANIRWIVQDLPWPSSRWQGIDMERFRELRAERGPRGQPAGGRRAARFFRENIGRPVHRSVVMALLHDQYDPMKRLRGNGGARDYLAPEGIAILSRHYDRLLVEKLGLQIGRDEFIAIRPTTPSARALLRKAGKIT